MVSFVAILMMVMLTMIGVAAIKMSNDEVSIAGNEMNEMQSFYAAEAGLERAAAALQNAYLATGNPPASLPTGSESISGCVSAYTTSVSGTMVQKELTQGTLAGLNAEVQTYTITSTGSSAVDHSQVTLSQEFECSLVPIFQFAAFYENDLELAPGTDMNILGRVHSNGDLWVMAGSKLNMESYLTASGQLYHGSKAGGVPSTGDIFIKDTEGNYQNMKNSDDSFLESTDAYWYDSASTRWGGRVQDSTFGQQKIGLPLADPDDPHKIIERATGNPDSYENAADFRVINGKAEALIGASWVDVTALLPPGTITSTTFTDLREGTNVKCTDIDLSILKTTAYYPDSGLIYCANNTGSFQGTRLVNGQDLGSPLSIFSEDPVYVQGDFNTVGKQPAAIAGDAVTILSNNWADSNSASGLASRVATPTTVNAAIITGNVSSTPGNYSGGLENLPRFLEDWSGTDFNFTGSMINLWDSKYANSLWSTVYFNEPKRNWSYDTDFDNPTLLPPESPKARIFFRTGWRQEHVGYTLDNGYTYDGDGITN
jgi:hypothetical protein